MNQLIGGNNLLETLWRPQFDPHYEKYRNLMDFIVWGNDTTIPVRKVIADLRNYLYYCG